MGWGLLRRVLGMNEMIIRLFTRALGNVSDNASERERFHEYYISVNCMSLRAVANFKSLSTQILRSSCMITE